MAAAVTDDPDPPPRLPQGSIMELYGTPTGKRIGRGSFGEIFITDKGYAVKIVQRGSQSRSAKELYTTDLNGLIYPLTLKHPGIIKCYNVYIGDKDIGSVLDLYQGDIFRSKIFQDLVIFKSLCAQMVSAVAYLTSRSILHGDIKPQNILYRQHPDGGIRFVLADFDIAQGRMCNYPNLAGRDLYTVNYRPPEMLIPARVVADHSADVWALGATLASAWHQDIIFMGYDENDVMNVIPKYVQANGTKGPGKLWIQALKPAPQTLTTKLASDPQVDTFLRKMLQIDPKDRTDIFELQGDSFLEDVPQKRIFPSACLERVEHFNRHFDWSPLKDNKILAKNWTELTIWMLEVGAEAGYSHSVSVMAIELLARYLLSKPELELGRLQLLGAACMYLAAIFDSYDLDASYFADATAGTYTADQVVELSIEILTTLDYDLCAKTGYDEIYRHLGSGPFSGETIDIAVELLWLAYTQFDLFVGFGDTAHPALYVAVSDTGETWPGEPPAGAEEWLAGLRVFFVDYQGPLFDNIFDPVMDIIMAEN